MTTADDRYRTLELGFIESGQEGGLRVVPAGLAVMAGEVLLAVGASGERHLLVPLLLGQAALEDRESANVTVTERPPLVLGDDGAHRLLDLGCNEPRLNVVFAKLVDDALTALRDQCPVPEPLGAPSPPQVIAEVLERWRELLSRAHTGARPSASGLLAEMHVVERLAAHDPHRALEAWTGPDRGARDFTSDKGLIEVKAFSTNRLDPVVEIHGLGQLEPPLNGVPLLLIVESFDRAGDGGDTIGQCARRLIDDLGCRDDVVRERLITAGLRVEDLTFDGWTEEEGFLSRAVFHYLVTEAFPRLDPGILGGSPAEGRVSAVTYQLDLSTEPPYPLEAAAPIIEDMMA